MEKNVFSANNLLILIGNNLYKIRFFMSFFYIGLAIVMLALLFRFCFEIAKFVGTVIFEMDVQKVTLIIKVLELVDMAMVAQLVWVVCLAGFSLFVTSRHFDPIQGEAHEKPDWLDHVNTYNLKLKLAFAIISISGVHALKTYLEGADLLKMGTIVFVHFLFVLSAIGIAFAEKLTHKT